MKLPPTRSRCQTIIVIATLFLSHLSRATFGRIVQPVVYTYRTNDRGDYSTYQDGVHRVFDNLISVADAADSDDYPTHPSVAAARTSNYHAASSTASSIPFSDDYHPKSSTKPKSSKARKKYDYVPLVNYVRTSPRPSRFPTPKPETGTGAISHINFSNEAWLKNYDHRRVEPAAPPFSNRSNATDADNFRIVEREDDDDDEPEIVTEDDENAEEPDNRSPGGGDRRYEKIERRKNIENVKSSTESTIIDNGGDGGVTARDRSKSEAERTVDDVPIKTDKGNSNRKYEKETIKYTEERSTLTTDRPLIDDNELESNGGDDDVDSKSHFDDGSLGDRLDIVETPAIDEEIEEEDDDEEEELEEDAEEEPLQIEQEDDADESTDESNAKSSSKILSKPLTYTYYYA